MYGNIFTDQIRGEGSISASGFGPGGPILGGSKSARTPGPVVSYRSFKHGKRSARAIAEAEYSRAAESLNEDGFGRIVEFTIPRASGKCKVFIKSKPDSWPNTTCISETEFQDAFSKPLHSSISAPMRVFLQNNDYIAS